MNKKNEMMEILKDCIKNGKHYYIFYDIAKENDIIHDISKWTYNFFVLSTDSIDALKTVNSSNYDIFDYDEIKIDELFEKIYKGKRHSVKKTDKISYKSKKIIYFFILPNIGHDKYDTSTENINYGFMNSTVSSKMKYNGFINFNNTPILCFKEKNLTNEIKNYDRNIRYLPITTGIGDFFIAFSYEYELYKILKSDSSATIKAQFPYYPYLTDNSKYMLDMCFNSELSFFNFANEQSHSFFEMYNKQLLYDFSKIYHVKNPDSGNHTLFLYAQMAGLDPTLNPYKYNDVLNAAILNKLNHSEKEYIDETISSMNNNAIGLHFFTGIYNYTKNKWMYDEKRQWDIDNINKFIELCSQNGVNLLILSPHPYENCNCKTLKALSIAVYAYVISKCKMLIGIDSSAGHIASFYNIPSITIWGEANPIKIGGSYNGYRALRKNYSIVPSDNNIKSVKYNVVYDILTQYLEGKITFSENIISYKDSLDNYNILHI